RRGGDGAAGRELRSRAVGVRGVDLGRSVPLGARGCAAASTRWPARLPPQLDARDPLLLRRGGPRGRDAAAAARRAASAGVTGGRRRVPPRPRRLGCAPTGERLRDRAARRAARAAGRRDAPVLLVRDGRVGPPLARRGDLAGAEAVVTGGIAKRNVLGSSETNQGREFDVGNCFATESRNSFDLSAEGAAREGGGREWIGGIASEGPQGELGGS